MRIPLSSIVVKDRVRKDVGEIGSLVDSMRKHGQLSAVVVTPKHELIAGHRRLLAAQKLGWDAIEAVIAESTTQVARLEMELQENVLRKDFTPEELAGGYERLAKLMRPSLWARFCNFWRRLWDRLFGKD